VPLYLKSNSYGEFIFDWGWANAAHRSGVRYYPKLVAAIPFTPVTGRACPSIPTCRADAAAVTAAMLRAIRQLADDERASSVHFLFCTEAEKARSRRTTTCRACPCSFTGTTAPDRRSRASTTT
jgi:predicted N-acyltransferase